jgi:hypothetical protein
MVRWLRRYAAAIWIAALALAALGARAIFVLPSGIYPELVFPRVVVVAHVGQLAPDLVEAQVTCLPAGARDRARRAPRPRAHDPRRRRALAAAHRLGRSAADPVRVPDRGRSRRAAARCDDDRPARTSDVGAGDHVQPVPDRL